MKLILAAAATLFAAPAVAAYATQSLDPFAQAFGVGFMTGAAFVACLWRAAHA